MSARALYVRIGLLAFLGVSLLVVASPPRPEADVPAPAAAVFGTAAGAALFTALSRARPRLEVPAHRFRDALVVNVIVGLLVANEELIWRRVVLGELLSRGSVVALAVSTIAFAGAHPTRRGLHLVTGAAFGGVYLATGSLLGSIAAHWTYNSLLSARRLAEVDV